MTPPRTIDEILAKFADEWYLNVTTDIHSKTPKQVIDQATQKIKQLLREKMPRKRTEPISDEITDNTFEVGFNQALAEMDKVIEGL